MKPNNNGNPWSGKNNILIRVKDHEGRVLADDTKETMDYKLEIPESLMERCRLTPEGKLLLQILGAVDYAGSGLNDQGQPVKKNPIMLMGRKHRKGTRVGHHVAWEFIDGFTLYIKVPLRLKSRPPNIIVPVK